MEDTTFNIFLFMIAFCFCWFITKTFIKSLKEFKDWILPQKKEPEIKEISLEEKEIEDFDFSEKMKKGYLTPNEKEIFRKKFLKK